MITNKSNHKSYLFVIFFILFNTDIFSQKFSFQSQNSTDEYKPVSLSKFFHRLDNHVFESFTHNNGMTHLTAIVGSYGMVHSGFDWKWYNFSYENREVYDAGFVSVEVGGIVPLTVPAGMYVLGRLTNDSRLQLTGIAVAQSALISLGITSMYKAITARRPPEDEDFGKPNYSGDFEFGLFNRGVFDGWPSGHTTTAFAMAFTLIEMYPENEIIQIAALIYASAIGLGVSTNIHWFSDAFAGALIGYSIGKTVGSGFHSLLTGEEDYEPPFSFYAAPGGIGVAYKF